MNFEDIFRSFVGSVERQRDSQRTARAFFGGLFGTPTGSPEPLRDAPPDSAPFEDFDATNDLEIVR